MTRFTGNKPQQAVHWFSMAISTPLQNSSNFNGLDISGPNRFLMVV